MRGKRARDPGLTLAITAAGGVRALAVKLGVGPARLCQWRTLPQQFLMRAAGETGLDPEAIRPDLAEWIEHERRRRWLARGRERFAIAAAAAAGSSELPGEEEISGLLLTLAACRFASQARGVQFERIIYGKKREEESARSYAMALAVNVARVSSTAIAGVFSCTRQNVDNASYRYLRQRDGDDADDAIEGDDGEARVIERGRLRRAKAGGDDSLWAAERRFVKMLDEGKL